jgi:hypothetical protein
MNNSKTLGGTCLFTSNEFTSTNPTLKIIKYIRTPKKTVGEREKHKICKGLQVTCSLNRTSNLRKNGQREKRTVKID